MMTSQGVFFGLLFLGTAGLVFVSRKALRDPHSHGFYRFFAWELLLVLLLRNIPGWFQHLLAWYQLVSWALLIVSLGLVGLGVRLLRQVGRQNAQRDPNLLGMEKTAHLVTVGLFRYIRHPLYSSLLFLAWGIFFKSPGWIDAMLALACTAFLVITARREEAENLRFFGSQYRAYMRESKMFIPYIV
jgi:protein-S-isoprenylcysteine O-methyltransferase Ste14